MAGTDALWMADAACTNRPDLDWFDLGCQLQAAVAVCRSCTVRTDCHTYAVSKDIEEGVWGGVWGYRLTGGRRRHEDRGRDDEG